MNIAKAKKKNEYKMTNHRAESSSDGGKIYRNNGPAFCGDWYRLIRNLATNIQALPLSPGLSSGLTDGDADQILSNWGDCHR